jgi:hypothetical protein
MWADQSQLRASGSSGLVATTPQAGPRRCWAPVLRSCNSCATPPRFHRGRVSSAVGSISTGQLVLSRRWTISTCSGWPRPSARPGPPGDRSHRGRAPGRGQANRQAVGAGRRPVAADVVLCQVRDRGRAHPTLGASRPRHPPSRLLHAEPAAPACADRGRDADRRQ